MLLEPPIPTSPELVSKVRDHFRTETDETFSDEAIRAAINVWIEGRLERMCEEIGEVVTSPHLAESLRFREILQSVSRPWAKAAPAPAPAAVPVTQPESVFNGFRSFSPAKLGAMIQYIARSGRDIYKTNLNKLLFYSDLTFYFQHGHGISGATYLNLPFGPVPDTIEQVLDDLAATGKIDRISAGPSGSNAQMIKLGAATSISSLLSYEEKNILDWVLDRYGHLSPTEISDLSHREKAYTSTRPNEPIAYEYSKFFMNLPS